MSHDDYDPLREMGLMFKLCVAQLALFYLLRALFGYTEFFRAWGSAKKLQFLQT